MSLIAEIDKLQERKDSLLREVALIDHELESVAATLGVRLKKTPSRDLPIAARGARAPRTRTPKGQTWAAIEFWLRSQSSAKTRKQIAEGAVFTQAAVDSSLHKHSGKLIHRGTRYGVSEAQFADHTAELEEERRGGETPIRSTSPVATSRNGATGMSSALMTTANTAPVASE